MKKVYEKYKELIIFGGLTLIVILFIIASVIIDASKWNAEKIGKKLMQEISSINNPVSVGVKDQLYSSKIILKDEILSNNESGIYIEFFENNQKAKIRYEYLEWENSNLSKIIEDYGDFYKKILWDETYNYLDGNAIIRLNVNYSESQKEEIINAFKKIQSSYKHKEKNKSSKKDYIEKELEKLKSLRLQEIDGYRVKLEKQLNDIINKIQNISINNVDEADIENIEKDLKEYSDIPIIKDIYDNALLLLEEKKKTYNEQLKEYAINITSQLNELKKSLDENKLTELQKKINNLNNEYYDKYQSQWSDMINEINEKIEEKKIADYKKECKNLNYKNVLRYPNDYLNKKAYWFGEVVQVIGDGQYRINVNCKKYQYVGGYYCNDTIYVFYDGNLNLIEDDMVKMWGYMSGNITYETVWGTSVTIPRFVAEYIKLN